MKVGDTVYIVNYRGIIEDYEIEKIGNKYFCLKNTRNRFRIKDLCSEFDNKKVYTDKQQIYDTREQRELFLNIKKGFDWVHDEEYTLDQLKRIDAIIKEREANA